MTAPNLAATTSIIGKTAVSAVTTTATAIITNDASSNKVFKINTLLISNIDGVNSADVTIDLFRSSVAYRIGNTIAVPADSTLDVIAKYIYLEEGDALRVTASANSDLEAICSYEELS
jgi:hypothetical protein